MPAVVLAVGLDPETRSYVLSRFAALGLEVAVVDRAEEAVTLAACERYELVACSYPLPDKILARFGRAVRAPDSASHDAAVLVLTLRDMRSEATLGLPHGRALVRSRNEPAATLDQAISHLLRLAPRRAAGASTRVLVDLLASHPEPAQVVNLSRTGMLVAHPLAPALASSCRFELIVDAHLDAIRGRAEVVRHASRTQERVNGFALRFGALEAAGSELLDRFLSAAE